MDSSSPSAASLAIASMIGSLHLEVPEPSETWTASQRMRALYDGESKALEIVKSLLEDEITRRAVHLNQKRNTLVTINNLPTELIGDMLLLSIEGHLRRVPRLQALASVCVKWRDVVTFTPGLWAVIKFGSDATELSLILRKAKMSPLHIECVGNSCWHGEGPSMRVLVDTISAHTSRWRSLVYHGGDFDPFRPYIKAGLPQLQHLDLGLNTNYLRSLVPVELGPSTQCRTVKLSMVVLSTWDNGALSGLEFLDIRHEPNMLPTPDQLIKILHSCPNLAVLALTGSQRVPVTDRLPSEETAVEAVPLPGLKSLTLQYIERGTTNALLERIRTASLERLVVQCLSTGATSSKLITFHSILTGNQQFSPLHTVVRNRPITQLHVEISSSSLFILDHSPKTPGIFSIDVQLNLGRPDWLTTSAATTLYSTIVDLDLPWTLKLGVGSYTRSELNLSFLDSLFNLQTLILGDGLDLGHIFQYLAMLQDDAWPCPDLRMIGMSALDDMDDGTTALATFPKVAGDLVRNRGAIPHPPWSEEPLGVIPSEKFSSEHVVCQEFRLMDRIGRRFDSESMTFGFVEEDSECIFRF